MVRDVAAQVPQSVRTGQARSGSGYESVVWFRSPARLGGGFNWLGATRHRQRQAEEALVVPVPRERAKTQTAMGRASRCDRPGKHHAGTKAKVKALAGAGTCSSHVAGVDAARPPSLPGPGCLPNKENPSKAGDGRTAVAVGTRAGCRGGMRGDACAGRDARPVVIRERRWDGGTAKPWSWRRAGALRMELAREARAWGKWEGASGREPRAASIDRLVADDPHGRALLAPTAATAADVPPCRFSRGRYLQGCQRGPAASAGLVLYLLGHVNRTQVRKRGQARPNVRCLPRCNSKA